MQESKKEGSFIKAHKLLRDAKRVYFLGFGYDQTNLDNLNIVENFLHKKDGEKSISQGASGTGFELAPSIRSTITTLYNRIKIDHDGIDCYNFLNNHGL